MHYAFKDKLDKAASDSLIRQLFWRDFYAQLLNEYPNLLFHPMKEQYAKIKWSSSQRLLDAWENGETGFPIVDAGMREVAATGYMHNRARLIAGSFLPRRCLSTGRRAKRISLGFPLLITTLRPTTATGNGSRGPVQIASLIFGYSILSLQSAKYDPDAEYIKKWVPELADGSLRIFINGIRHIVNKNVDYPAPIVDYAKQKDKVLDAYRSVSVS